MFYDGSRRLLAAAALAIHAALLVAGAAQAAETRCGWVDNPTPANWSLTDRDGEWTLSVQGGYEAAGMDLVPELTEREFVETNGSYGYACACFSVRPDRREMRIAEVLSVVQMPISQCLKDPALPKR